MEIYAELDVPLQLVEISCQSRENCERKEWQRETVRYRWHHPCPPSPLHCSGEGRGVGSGGQKLNLGKEDKKDVVLMFVFVFHYMN